MTAKKKSVLIDVSTSFLVVVASASSLQSVNWVKSTAVRRASELQYHVCSKQCLSVWIIRKYVIFQVLLTRTQFSTPKHSDSKASEIIGVL